VGWQPHWQAPSLQRHALLSQLQEQVGPQVDFAASLVFGFFTLGIVFLLSF
jgi:hypothetical protein